MLEQSTSKQDNTLAIAPESRSRMPWRVAKVEPLIGFRLAVRFVDGAEGIVDLSGLIRSARAGVFAQLADEALFDQVFVEGGAVTWPGELDLAPDAMYGEIKKSGEWIIT